MIQTKTLKLLVKNLKANKPELLDLAVKATGTPQKYHEQDLNYSISFINDLVQILNSFISAEIEKNILIKPKGRIFMVLSANEPMIMSFIPVLSALSLGNEILLKSASNNLEFNKKLLEIYNSSGIEGLALVDFPKEDLGKFLDTNKPDAAAWFGSSRVIKAVAPEFAKRMIEFLPECEGNEMVYISENYKDIKKAAGIILHSLIRHQGQCCNAIKGILISSKIKEKLIKVVKEEAAKLKGDQLNVKDIDFIAPELVKGLDPFKVSEELPVISEVKGELEMYLNNNPFTVKQWIYTVNGLDQALDIVSKNPFGIGFTLFSDSNKDITEVINSVNTARINLNRDPLEVEYVEPWGGTGLSGFGGARPWLDKFSNKTYLAGADD
jgi:acyl-CoA reductase-like NAD-dependent aldehyde dehydrogenase